MIDAIAEVESEAETAQLRYGDFTSTHEALGVLAEEFSELIEAVRSNDLETIRSEAVQVSAVALRLAAQCSLPIEAFRKRSGSEG